MTAQVLESEELLTLLDRVSRSVKKQHRQVEFDDLYQESWAWACANEKVVFDHKENSGYVWKAVRNHLVKYAREWLAGTNGYDVEDSYFYTIPQLRTLLQAAFTPEWMAQGQQYDRQPGSGEASDPANAWAMVADAKTGYSKLSDRDRDLLWRVLGEPGEYKQILRTLAPGMGLTEHALNQRCNDALSRLRRHLGGGRPRD